MRRGPAGAQPSPPRPVPLPRAHTRNGCATGAGSGSGTAAPGAQGAPWDPRPPPDLHTEGEGSFCSSSPTLFTGGCLHRAGKRQPAAAEARGGWSEEAAAAGGGTTGRELLRHHPQREASPCPPARARAGALGEGPLSPPALAAPQGTTLPAQRGKLRHASGAFRGKPQERG